MNVFEDELTGSGKAWNWRDVATKIPRGRMKSMWRVCVMLGDTVTARQALQKAGQDGTADLKSLDTLDKLKEDAAAAYNSKDFRKVELFAL